MTPDCTPPPPPGGCYPCHGEVICVDGPYVAPVDVPGPSAAGLLLTACLIAAGALRAIQGRG